MRHKGRNLILLLAVTVAILAVAVPVCADEIIGRVIGLQGEAWAERASGREALAMRGNIYQHDQIVTGANSKVQVMFLDQTIYALGPESRLEVAEYHFDEQKSAFFRMHEGAFRMISGEIVEANPDGFNLASPNAAMGIRGTMTGHLITGSSEHHYTLDIQPGHRVEVSSGGQLQVMRADQTAIDVTPTRISRPRPMTSDEVQRFEQIITIDPGAQPMLPPPPPPDGTQPPPDGTQPPPDGTYYLPPPPDGEITYDPLIGTVKPPPDKLRTAVTYDQTRTTVEGTLNKRFNRQYMATVILWDNAGTPTPIAVYSTPGMVDVTASSKQALYMYGSVGSSSKITIDEPGFTPGGLEYAAYYSSPDLYAWSGGMPAYYQPKGGFDDGITCFMEWGYWEMSPPGQRVTLDASGASMYINPYRAYTVSGDLTSAADLGALRSNSVTASYAGKANAVYFLGTNPPIDLIDGSFNCNINFGTDQVNNARILFTSPVTLDMNGGSGSLGSDGTYSITFPTIITPQNAASTNTSTHGGVFGPNGRYTGGGFSMTSSSGEYATGEFHGVRQ